jgi:hypothetical protein
MNFAGALLCVERAMRKFKPGQNRDVENGRSKAVTMAWVEANPLQLRVLAAVLSLRISTVADGCGAELFLLCSNASRRG